MFQKPILVSVCIDFDSLKSLFFKILCSNDLRIGGEKWSDLIWSLIRIGLGSDLWSFRSDLWSEDRSFGTDQSCGVEQIGQIVLRGRSVLEGFGVELMHGFGQIGLTRKIGLLFQIGLMDWLEYKLVIWSPGRSKVIWSDLDLIWSLIRDRSDPKIVRT